jgi:hypothetical protein
MRAQDLLDPGVTASHPPGRQIGYQPNAPLGASFNAILSIGTKPAQKRL